LITFDGIRNKEYHGEVVEIASIGSENSGVVDFTVTVQMTDVDEDVLPGMTAEVDIVVEQTEAALLVPNQAIRTNESGAQIVYIMETGGQMTEVEIKLGASSDTQSEIAEGNLQAGDQIVLNPPSEDEDDFQPPMGPMGGGGQQGGGMPNPHQAGGQ
jgi:HlyD family secretion protein